jgi:ankyrin repeat protein
MDTGATPLYIAAQQGQEAIVQALIEVGADVNKARDDAWTPLSIAAQVGHTAIGQILRDAVLVRFSGMPYWFRCSICLCNFEDT